MHDSGVYGFLSFLYDQRVILLPRWCGFGLIMVVSGNCGLMHFCLHRVVEDVRCFSGSLRMTDGDHGETMLSTQICVAPSRIHAVALRLSRFCSQIFRVAEGCCSLVVDCEVSQFAVVSTVSIDRLRFRERRY